ncbi:hypothetical protein [Cellulomonas sp. ATA003]|uniref:hypothetical protein n=1 Tax=Cellulomonas sp. ATA003 TaxID=3073064 RepID=UPI002873E3DF|nr:hypothetical protein [Cellulomonas sp. ATA003]WNB84526.1 hypothetical protein REH70_11865 [Cellulomonas sp. ATA003]
MGATNVKLAYGRWGHLPDRPFRLLAYMANVAHDTDSPGITARRFWGGRDDLAYALGRGILPPAPESDDDSPEAVQARKARHAAYVAVSTAMTCLRKAGAIRPVTRGRSGRRAEYELVLDLLSAPAQVQGKPVPEPSRVPWEDLVPEPTSQADPAPQGQGEPVPVGQGEPDQWATAALAPRNHEDPLQDSSAGPSARAAGADRHLPNAHEAADADDEYGAATKALERLGPDRYGELVQAAATAQPDATVAQWVLAAASTLRTGAA